MAIRVVIDCLFRGICFLCILFFASFSLAKVITVAPSDQSSLVLERALAEAAQFRLDNPDENVIIRLSDGIYRLSSTLQVPQSASGSKGLPTILTAENKGKVWISGSAVLPASKELDSRDASKFTEDVRRNIRVFDLRGSGMKIFGLSERSEGTSGIAGPSEIILNNLRQNLSRWPRVGFFYLQDADAKKALSMFEFSPSDLGADIWSYGFWRYDWSAEYIRLIVRDGLYEIERKPKWGLKIGQRVAFFNIPSKLSFSGDYFIDQVGERLLFYGSNEVGAELSQVVDLLSIDGVHDFGINGINFENGRGTAISGRNVARVVIEGCEIRNMGQSGIQLYGKDSGVSGCELYSLGESGVILSGGDRQTLESGGMFVRHTSIHDYGQWVATYRPAVALSGVGNSISASHFYNAPHSAVMISGNDHTVELNDIHDVVKIAGDAGAIYMGRDWAARGNKILGNYFHDIGRASDPSSTVGIYLDDQFSGVTISNNIFSKVNNAVFVGGGRNNSVVGNFFVNSSPAMMIDERGTRWQRGIFSDSNSVLRKALAAVPYKGGVYSKYPNLSDILSDDPGAAKYNVFSGNVVIGGICVKRNTEISSFLTQDANTCVESPFAALPFINKKIYAEIRNEIRSRKIYLRLPDSVGP